MKKRLLGLVSIICLIAVIFSFGAFTVSADAQFVNLTTLSFENLTVGTASNSTSEKIQTGNAYFDTIYPRGGTMVVMEEGGEKFVRTTSTTNTSYVAFVPTAASKADLPAQDYQITITYRLSDDFANQAGKADKTFVIRSQSSGGADDTRILASEDYAQAKGTWKTTTVVSKAKGDLTGYWLFAYVNSGCYIDIKSIEWKASAQPLFDQKADFNAAAPADVTYVADTKGADITKVEVWNKTTEEFETLDASNYVIGNGTMTVKASYLSTLSNGLKSIICYVNGVKYATVIYVYNSTVAEDPVSLGKPTNTPDAPAEEKGGCGSVITATSVALASVLLAGAVVVLKKKH
ncbi:MAG: hypothetical protein E7342_02265 [Clostridiales bacterium]|nr:hypothetical protein [Clostridiales bacterium]